MAISFTGNKVFSTPNTDLWSGQANASVSFFLRIDACDSSLNTSGVIRHSTSALSISFTTQTLTDPTKFRLRITTFNNAAASATADVTLSLNTVYHIALVFTSGAQWLYVNGSATRFGVLTGTTPTATNVPFQIGSQNANVFTWSLDDLSVWNGYALTPENVADLRDRLAFATTIGGDATKRARWTLAGTVGAPVVPNAAGLLDSMLSPIHFSQNAVGAGTAVYASALPFVPTVEAAQAYVATSGQSVGFGFARIADGQLTMPIAEIFRPTIRINGGEEIELENPWITGIHTRILYTLPEGTRVMPGDTVTWSAHNGWLNAVDGVVLGADDAPMTNRANKTVTDVENLPKTLRYGWNMTAVGTINYITWLIFANRVRIMSQFSNVLATDDTGKPISLTQTTANANIIASAAANNIDSTGTPFQEGYYAVSWDDPANTLDFTMVSNTGNVLCTEVTGLANPGTAGIGKCKVYWIRYTNIATTTSYGPAIALRMTCASKIPQFDNLWVCSPGDFEWTADTPTVIDRSDPWRLSADLLSKIPHTRGLCWVARRAGSAARRHRPIPSIASKSPTSPGAKDFPKAAGA